jgi:hypothetical protein
MAEVTALAAEAGPPAGRPSPGRLEVGYVTGDEAARLVALAESQALTFECFLPVRRSPPGRASGI